MTGLFHNKSKSKPEFDSNYYIELVKSRKWLADEDKEKAIELIKQMALMFRKERELAEKRAPVVTSLLLGSGPTSVTQRRQIDELLRETAAVAMMRAHLTQEMITLEEKYADMVKKNDPESLWR